MLISPQHEATAPPDFRKAAGGHSVKSYTPASRLSICN